MDETSRNWLKMAEEDLVWSRASFKDRIWRGVCFTAQQSVEKALKAFLLSKNTSLPKIHDLVALNEECQKLNGEFQNLVEACNILSPYYLSSRYPDIAEFENYSEDLAKNALEQAENALKFIKSKI